MDSLSLALDFATKAHKGQKRFMGTPYIEHPIAVMMKLKNLGIELPILKAAILHDVQENCDVQNLELVTRFGEKVAFFVDSLSKEDKENFSNDEFGRVERIRDYLKKLKYGFQRFPVLSFVKIADQLDNIQTIEIFREDKFLRIIYELESLYIPLYKHVFTEISDKYKKDYLCMLEELIEIVGNKKRVGYENLRQSFQV